MPHYAWLRCKQHLPDLQLLVRPVAVDFGAEMHRGRARRQVVLRNSLWNGGATCGGVLTQIAQPKSQIDAKQCIFHQRNAVATSQARDSVEASATTCFSQRQRRKAVKRPFNRSNSLVKKTVYLASLVPRLEFHRSNDIRQSCQLLVLTALLEETLLISRVHCCWCAPNDRMKGKTSRKQPTEVITALN